MMERRDKHFRWMMVLLMTIGASCHQVMGQSSDLSFEELQKNYTWGSIYFSYDPICDLIYDLKNPSKLKLFESSDKHRVIPLLQALFHRNMGKDRSESIAFLQINLVAKQAGYMNGSDRDGVIKPLPWGTDQVLRVANFCDRILNGHLTFNNLQQQLREGRLALVDAWVGIETLRQDPFIPTEKISILLASYRELLEKNPVGLARLAVENKAMYDYIGFYIKKFDTLDNETGGTWLALRKGFAPAAYYHNPFNNELSTTLVRNEELMMAGLAEWKTQNSPGPSASLEHARSLYKARNFNQALEEIRRITDLEPTNGTAYLLAGQIYMALNRNVEAIAVLKTAIFWEPKQVEGYILLARLYFSRHDRAEALKYVISAISIDPNNKEANDLRQKIQVQPARPS